MRRAAGLLLILGGGALLGYAGIEYARGAIARDAARTEWARLEARRAVLAVEAAAGYRMSTPPVPGVPVARIRIPSLDLDEIVVEGTGEDELNAGPGHLRGTPLPGAPGNAVVSAHRDRHFHRLGDLRVGDTITTDTEHGFDVWVVTERRVVPKDARVIRRSAESRLTLTTCWPIRFFGPAPERLIVTALPARPGHLAAGDPAGAP